jgi:hypothetical protein
MKFATLCYVRKDGRTLMIHRVKQEGDMPLYSSLRTFLSPLEFSML